MHSQAIFNLLLSWPLFAKAALDAVLLNPVRAQIVFRLALGVSEEYCRRDKIILCPNEEGLFHALPFELLQEVLEAHSQDVNRQQIIDLGIVQLLLSCLAVFTQQVKMDTVAIPSESMFYLVDFIKTSVELTVFCLFFSFCPALKARFVVGAGSSNAPAAKSGATKVKKRRVQKPQHRWAKGTGYGIGGGHSGVENDLHKKGYGADESGYGNYVTEPLKKTTFDSIVQQQRQRQQEGVVPCIIRSLAAFIHPNGPPQMLGIFQSSRLVTVICSYLRNNSSEFFVVFFFGIGSSLLTFHYFSVSD